MSQTVYYLRVIITSYFIIDKSTTSKGSLFNGNVKVNSKVEVEQGSSTDPRRRSQILTLGLR